MKKTEKKFRFQAKQIPTAPGCYLFWDENDHLLYVGKAKNLRKRVASYFQSSRKSGNVSAPTNRMEVMVKKIMRIETRQVGSEMEALILENNLVKEFQPRFNVKLKDDKNFVYLRITAEKFPKMEITRHLLRDHATYIGPKTSVKEFRDTVRFCQKFFRVHMTRSSLDYYPLASTGGREMDEKKYNENVEMMKKFLRGQTDDVMRTLQERMMQFVERKNFEAAALTRDLIRSIEQSTQKQTVQFQDNVNRDFVNFVRDGNEAYFVRIAFREGKLLDQNEVALQAPDFLNDAELVEGFLLQFYEHVAEMPSEIFVPTELENRENIERTLSETETAPSRIQVPQRGDKKSVLDIAQKNAKHFAERRKLEAESHAENFATALPELAKELKLKTPPHRIECFDISHFSGDATVASQVVFFDGQAQKSEYRRFHVKTLPDGKIDDFSAMTEILERRFARAYIPPSLKKRGVGGDFQNPPLAPPLRKEGKKLPDLIVIDGGQGQLSAVMKAVKKCSKDKKFPKSFQSTKQIIALAKREELIFRPGHKDPLELSLDSAALKLLQRIRDEAHRFAITFNRSVRQKAATKSVLDTIPGIGNATRKKLIQKFGSLSGVREASDQALREILSEKQIHNLRKNI